MIRIVFATLLVAGGVVTASAAAATGRPLLVLLGIILTMCGAGLAVSRRA